MEEVKSYNLDIQINSTFGKYMGKLVEGRFGKPSIDKKQEDAETPGHHKKRRELLDRKIPLLRNLRDLTAFLRFNRINTTTPELSQQVASWTEDELTSKIAESNPSDWGEHPKLYVAIVNELRRKRAARREGR